MKSILQAQGITVLEEGDGGDGVSVTEVTREQDDGAESVVNRHNAGRRQKRAEKRRVSRQDIHKRIVNYATYIIDMNVILSLIHI